MRFFAARSLNYAVNDCFNYTCENYRIRPFELNQFFNVVLPVSRNNF